MTELVLRSARADDADLLVELLGLAAAWRPGDRPPPPAVVRDDPGLAVYVAGWPRPGDVGVIAELDGAAVGGAWARTATADHHGYGWVAPDVPEVSVAVRPGHRGRGVGAALLTALADALTARGVARASLSVEVDNPAARLYRRLGWRELGGGAGDATMVLDLGSGPGPVSRPPDGGRATPR